MRRQGSEIPPSISDIDSSSPTSTTSLRRSLLPPNSHTWEMHPCPQLQILEQLLLQLLPFLPVLVSRQQPLYGGHPSRRTKAMSEVQPEFRFRFVRSGQLKHFAFNTLKTSLLRQRLEAIRIQKIRKTRYECSWQGWCCCDVASENMGGPDDDSPGCCEDP